MVLVGNVPQVRFPYRATTNGGFDFSYVFTQDGTLLKPVFEERSRSGRHGEDVYELGPGVYYAVIFTRPNNPRRLPSVTYMRVTVSSNEVRKEVISEGEMPEPVLARTRSIYNRLVSE